MRTSNKGIKNLEEGKSEIYKPGELRKGLSVVWGEFVEAVLRSGRQQMQFVSHLLGFVVILKDPGYILIG